MIETRAFRISTASFTAYCLCISDPINLQIENPDDRLSTLGVVEVRITAIFSECGSIHKFNVVHSESLQ